MLDRTFDNTEVYFCIAIKDCGKFFIFRNKAVELIVIQVGGIIAYACRSSTYIESKGISFAGFERG